MNKEIEIIGPDGMVKVNKDSLFIVAEVGNQFNGNLETAKKLAKAAKDAGADAVKYIFWFPDQIMAGNPMYSYEVYENQWQMLNPADSLTIVCLPVSKQKTEPMFDLLNRLRLTLAEWQEVKIYCDKLSIIMTTTVNCPGAFDYATDLGLPLLKLSSWDWNFPELWQWCARSMLPVFADVGPATSQEFDRNIGIFEEERNKNLALLHCFHTKDPRQMNMKFIGSRGLLMGYSATDYNDDLDCLAIGLGACVLEKRLTLDRKGGVLHDAVSKEPDEFRHYVTRMRNLQKALGTGAWQPSDEDMRQRKLWFRRIVADSDIPKGSPILRSDIECKRGETGIQPARMEEVVGRIAKRDIKRNDDITESDY